MNIVQKIGLGLFIIALSIFTIALGLSKYKLTADSFSGQSPIIENEYHRTAVATLAEQEGIIGKEYGSNIAFIRDYKQLLKSAQQSLSEKEIPEGLGEWDFKIGDWKIKEYVSAAVQKTAYGLVPENKGLFLFLTFGLAILGGLLYILPQFTGIPGIKNNGIYQSSMTRGLELNWRTGFLGATIIGVLVYGFFYISNFFWPLVSALVIGLIIYLVFFREDQKDRTPAKSASPTITAWLGVLTGIYFIGFYILLYWAPAYISNWVAIVDPVSKALSGGNASQWFLYGLMYSVIVIVMGLRMIAKYRHNKYQILRTSSVMFFQTAFAFLIPEILLRLNQPYFDFKNIWPLDYDFFFNYNLDDLYQNGAIGIFMLVWGILLIVLGVPLFTYFFGKRWYCSWVCGCGGLAETLGDPYRQLSDKSLRAWKFERWIIHGVLVAAIIMTFMVLYTYFTGSYNVLFMNSDTVRTWYGFFIGSAFSGVVGTGFYPLMGNRVWCRFGCPLAAYLGLVQRFKSRFRITTNGGQCISCGNCSTYCEMGIDVRSYAQKGQDIVRASCVGCGVCAAVCPRGVLRLENEASDVDDRMTHSRAIHVSEKEVGLLM